MNILYLEDEKLDFELAKASLAGLDCDCTYSLVDSESAYSQALENNSYSLILADFQLPSFDGHRALEIAKEKSPNTPFIFVSGKMGEQFAVEAMRWGADDYVLKQHLHNLSPAVKRALDRAAEHNKRLDAEKKLAASEKRFQDLFDNAPDMYFSIDPQGIVLSVNLLALQVLGYKEEEIVGQSVLKVVWSDDVSAVKKQLESVSDSEGPYSEIEFRKVRKDGSIIWVHERIRFFKLSEQAEPELRVICRDITAQKQVEQEKEELEGQLRHALKMEAVGTLAGGIAHDFNNILAVVLGYADMARDDIPEWSSARHMLDKVINAATRATDLVKHILAFSRKTDPKRISVNIHLMVREVLELLRATTPTSIEIKQEISSDCGRVLADASQLQQVMFNLCANAILSMEEKGGILGVSLSNVELSEDDLRKKPDLTPGTFVKISVADTGAGIDPQIIDRIFDPYFTTRDIGKGSGLGLSVVHGIVESHEGMIAVESELDKGTSFNIYLPQTEYHEEPVETRDASLPLGNERILVVDDEENIADLTKRIFERLGYQVVAKVSSVEALEYFKAQPEAIDLVVTDQTMPKMSGVQLAKEMMKIREDIPIVLCSGHSASVDEDIALGLGIKAFVMKPASKEKLATTVRQALDDK